MLDLSFCLVLGSMQSVGVCDCATVDYVFCGRLRLCEYCMRTVGVCDCATVEYVFCGRLRPCDCRVLYADCGRLRLCTCVWVSATAEYASANVCNCATAEYAVCATVLLLEVPFIPHCAAP